MFRVARYLLLVSVVALLVSGAHGWWSRRSSSSSTGSRPTDLPYSGLRSLYNKRVTRAEVWERPLDSFENIHGVLRHNGIVITDEDGVSWLVHKGADYGHSSNTVITRASHMSSRWSLVKSKSIYNSWVSDYVGQGGRKYWLFWDNCQDATERMWDNNN